MVHTYSTPFFTLSVCTSSVSPCLCFVVECSFSSFFAAYIEEAVNGREYVCWMGRSAERFLSVAWRIVERAERVMCRWKVRNSEGEGVVIFASMTPRVFS